MTPMLLTIVFIIILSGLSFADKHLTFAAGLAWLWGGMFVFIDVHVSYMLIALIVGLYFIFKGVWLYVPD